MNDIDDKIHIDGNNEMNEAIQKKWDNEKISHFIDRNLLLRFYNNSN